MEWIIDATKITIIIPMLVFIIVFFGRLIDICWIAPLFGREAVQEEISDTAKFAFYSAIFSTVFAIVVFVYLLITGY